MSVQPVTRSEQTLSDSQLIPVAPLIPVTLCTPPDTGAPPTILLPSDSDGVLPQKTRLGRFEVHSEIGRGGMGAVLRGRDPALGRDLAIKVLLAGRQRNPESLRRFHEEAQIGGQLQHPGLVPVYEMGTDDEGRPFFAMKLVDGRTLAALLHERQRPADNLPLFLGIFEQTCQALAYAHARGVIHRDLKPANVMVGAFGEVQVMDWGLAKVLTFSRETPTSASPTLAGVSRLNVTSEASESRDGAVLGTPAYMPPEQARGEIEHLDQRADVFGLGAILCEILTGQPPFTGHNVSEILGRAARNDLTEAFARLDGCGADAELIGLAKSCLSPEPNDRPHDGSAVATQVAAYRAGVAERLRKSEMDRAAAEVRAVEERRRRRTQLALAAAVLLLLVLGGGGGWWVRHQQLERQQEQDRKQLELERAVERDLVEVAEKQGQMQLTAAWAALERAEGRLGESGSAALRERVADTRRTLQQIRTDRNMTTRLEDVRVQVIGPRRPHSGANEAFRDAYISYGLDVEKGDPEIIADKIRHTAIQEELVSQLYQWAFTIGQEDQKAEAIRLARLAARADPDLWRRQLAEALIREDRETMLQLARQADPAKLSPATTVMVAACFEIVGRIEEALPLMREVQQRHADNFLINFALAQYCLHIAKPPQPDDAVRFFTAASALRPRNAIVLIGLGQGLKAQFKFREAIRVYQQACRVRPNYREAHNVLGTALLDQGNGDMAETEIAARETIRLFPDDVDAHNILGIALREQGKLPEAEAACREAIRLQPDAPRAHCSLGFVLRLQRQFEASRDEFRRGHELNVKPTGWHGPTKLWLREAERLVELDRRWPDILNGKAKATNAAEQIEFAQLCDLKHHHATAARFYADAFQADASLANDLVKMHRYNAARSAVLAAAGKREEAKPLDGAERTRLRKQALGWLRDDLAAWDKRLDGGKPEDLHLVETKMRHWQKDVDLTSVRDTIDNLPEAERADWQKLWKEVETLRQRAAGSE